MSFLTAVELLRHLQSGRRMLADGAVGSELIGVGIPPERTVSANLTHPEAVSELHRRAISAGAEILTSNTFGAPAGDRWEAEFHAGVERAVAAARDADREIAVMLSVYPEELLARPDTVFAPFREPQTQECLLLIETAVAFQAAVEAVALAREHGVATIATTCHFQSDGTMPDGTSPTEAAERLHLAGAAVVGANCGAGADAMLTIAQQMRRATDLPLLFQPNEGLPQWREGRWVYSGDTDRFAAVAASLFDAGASIVGGCCGTTPAHIAAVYRLLFDPQRRE